MIGNEGEMYVKICGLRARADAELAARAGADAVGVVMSEGSPRNASRAEAAGVIAAAKAIAPGIDTVLVVSNTPATSAAEIARDLGFDVLQLHGTYTREDVLAARQLLPRVWRATSLTADPELRAGAHGEERLLVDGSTPGSGETWNVAAIDPQALGDGWILAGGLSPANVATAIATVQPFGVDVSSGVESTRGVKDPTKILEFIRAARGSAATKASAS